MRILFITGRVDPKWPEIIQDFQQKSLRTVNVKSHYQLCGSQKKERKEAEIIQLLAYGNWKCY